MVKPVTQVNTQLVSSVSCELSESIEFLEWFLGVNQASQVIKHITGKQGVLRKDVYIFFSFFFFFFEEEVKNGVILWIISF